MVWLEGSYRFSHYSIYPHLIYICNLFKLGPPEIDVVSRGIGLEDLPERSVLLIEEDLGSVKDVFIQSIGSYAIEAGKDVVYITSRFKEDIHREISAHGFGCSEQLKIIEKFSDREALLDTCGGDICIIDNFTRLFIDSEMGDLIDTLESLIDSSRKDNRIFLLTSNIGILTERSEKVIRSMVDGVIQFLVEYSGNRIDRFINIPKLGGSLPPDRMISFKLVDEGISVDTRERFGR